MNTSLMIPLGENFRKGEDQKRAFALLLLAAVRRGVHPFFAMSDDDFDDEDLEDDDFEDEDDFDDFDDFEDEDDFDEDDELDGFGIDDEFEGD
jgi:hypothetical protein